MQERSRKEKNILYIVVPCYNEEQVLAETSKRLKEKCEMLIHDGKIAKESRIVFVDDGSKDHTWNMIDEFHKMDSIFSGVKLSRNRGHQNALLAGLTMASEKADIVISMDADLQDDINAVDQMIEKYYEGCDIVYGVRSARDTDTFFKRFTAEAFYKLINKMGGELVYNHADYRLMSKRALKGLLEFDEVNIFLRGMVPMVGYQSDIVTYERAERFAGESKYPLKKMLSFAFSIPNELFTSAFRLMKFFLIILCAFWGLYGFFLGFLAMFIHLFYLENYGVPYAHPMVEERGRLSTAFQDFMVRYPLKRMKYRPEFTKEGARVRQKEDEDEK